ncbi:MAG: glycosyltransferase family 2 protein [Methanobrevibacter sp.]|uniref:Glycosyltransferase family 2 protein n=1 Tax=Methanobrevibacter millerae TaxID=230361 RepID=A0A8T3VKW9_9EURY|nr:glycosyltransferase family 2 protein [Methanobrevibacter millerae]MBE6504814.1 glycosyltransferase family 2 protein [Methanobrevibacter millerae]MBR0057873.1 glycosyltransferase family 2 protein [Methanobrevibacter sp.]MBR0370492.1 glycosyltransferase family 2 protein [Methanobrevibacter sp.]
MDVKISIVLPVYNVANYLRKCLDSLVNQTFEDFEVICVNDGSTDLSLGILEGYSLTDSRFKIITQENQGLSGARNTGIQHVQGDYILFVDSDDWLEETALEQLYEHVEGFNSDITMFKFKYYNENSSEFSEGPFTNLEIIDPSFYTGNFFYMDVLDIIFKISHAPFNKLYKTSFLKDIDAQFLHGSYYEDLEFFYKVFLKAKKVSVLPEYLYYYRIRDHSISTSGDEGSFDIFNILELTKQYFIDASVYNQIKQDWLMFTIVNLKFVYLRLNEKFKNQFIQLMKEKYYDYSLNEVVYSENWHYEDRAFHESILPAENYKEFDLNYDKNCYEILYKHYETLSNEYKKQIDMLTDKNNQLKEELNESSIKNKFKKIVKS